MPEYKNYRYILDPARGSATKTSCPHCGLKKCFKRYVDRETGEYLSDDCGRCDHEQSCGYHYTPSQFYKDNAWRKDLSTKKSAATKKVEVKPPVYITFPMTYVNARHSPNSVFMQWLSRVIADLARVNEVYNNYYIGATQDNKHRPEATIFWYIDINGIVHDGKLMWFKDNGHRENFMDCISSRMRKAKMIDENAQTRKPFFGEHLLAIRREAPVCVVESEKSAVVCACLFSESIWLATGGCKNLNAEMVKVLQGRHVTFYPDSGKLEEWKEKMKPVEDIDYRFCEDFEHYPDNTDLVDVLLGEVQLLDSHNTDHKEYVDPVLKAMVQANPDIEYLISTFDLEVTDSN